MLPPARFHVFVYGTLRPGGHYARLLCTPYPHHYTPAFVRGRLFRLRPGYPGLARGDQWIRGEVLSFNAPELLAALDRLEDYDPGTPVEKNVYVREPVEAYDVERQPIGPVLTYLMTEARIREWEGALLQENEWPVSAYP